MKDQRGAIVDTAVELAKMTKSDKLFIFIDTIKDYHWFLKHTRFPIDNVILVMPKDIEIPKVQEPQIDIINSWAGNQSRFSRIKYAFLQAVLRGLIDPKSKAVCVLGPWGKGHLDTITVHDLGLSWSEEFPFDPRPLIAHKAFFTIMAVVDIALDIGALGREGKPVGTAFIVGDTENTMRLSHQAVFNPFKGYPREERLINKAEVVESIKEIAQLDGAFIVSEDGVVEAAGRHLDARASITHQIKGLGSRHRSCAAITRQTKAVAIVVSESTGKLTIFERGRILSTLEPVIGRRLV